jgi:hypothetical protein
MCLFFDCPFFSLRSTLKYFMRREKRDSDSQETLTTGTKISSRRLLWDTSGGGEVSKGRGWTLGRSRGGEEGGGKGRGERKAKGGMRGGSGSDGGRIAAEENERPKEA